MVRSMGLEWSGWLPGGGGLLAWKALGEIERKRR